MDESAENDVVKPSVWGQWYPLFIFLAVLSVCFGVAAYMVGRDLYEKQPQIHTLAWSPDGKAYATAHTDGSVLITTLKGNAPSDVRMLIPRPKGRWDWPEPRIYSLQWSPDGKYIAGAGWRYLQAWEVETGKETCAPVITKRNQVFRWDGDSRCIWSMNTLPYDGSEPLHIEKHEMVKGVRVQDVTVTSEISTKYSIGSFIPYWSIDGTRVIVRIFPDKKTSILYVLDAKTGSVLNKWDQDSNRRIDIVWNPSGTLVAILIRKKSMSAISSIEIKDVETGKLLQTMDIPIPSGFTGLAPGSADLRWSKDGATLACALMLYSNTYRNTEDCMMTWWNVADGKLIADKILSIKGTQYKQEYFSGTSNQIALYKAWMEKPYWSPDLQSVAVCVQHMSLLAIFGPGYASPPSTQTCYGDYGSVVIGKAPATVAAP